MEYVEIEGEGYFKISNVDSLRPFFMSIVSDSDHWLFISSNGGLSAGRKNNSHSLFPYYSDDRVTESFDNTGSKSVFRIDTGKKQVIWEPFSDRFTGVYSIQRNLYKNDFGNKVIFEEINEDLGLAFRYSWKSSDQYGFVKTSRISNLTEESKSIEILDGIQNILPHGVDPDLQRTSSNLIDAYKKAELSSGSGLGIFSLSAIIVDRAEPSEALKANVVWSLGLEADKILLSSLQLNDFRRGKTITQESDIRAERGAYFVNASIAIPANDSKSWHIIANTSQGPSQVANLSRSIEKDDSLEDKLELDINSGTMRLLGLTHAADGKQLTNDQRKDTRHFANSMFNIMRGGIFDENYKIEKEDFLSYLATANKELSQKQSQGLNKLPDEFDLLQVQALVESSKDADFTRLCYEYLPLKFSRRHGDPSRPWNKFSINTKNDDGSKVLDYQGNWRDIFQNWEALAHSYPLFINGMIHKFLNASTFEGYNPYRVTKGGFDWETIEPDDPWSYIGYWGDHQLIYLLKFLEFSEKHFKGFLSEFFTEDIFTYANVPYRIKTFEEILKDPKDTIIFDEELDHWIRENRNDKGADGALLENSGKEIHHVNFIEKILATLLSKTSNLIPGGGIWMNTQRPEWNDANNALVGNGISMVTLYYMRRFVKFLQESLGESSFEGVEISEEQKVFFDNLAQVLSESAEGLKSGITDEERFEIVSRLGEAGSNFREKVYDQGFSGGKSEVSQEEIMSFLDSLVPYLDFSIKVNKRTDGLYHAYNLIERKSDKSLSINHLSEMLEGQVAVLSSGALAPEEVIEVLDAMRISNLYRADQNTYLLYPNKQLPIFLNRNIIPIESVKKSSLFEQLIKVGDSSVIEQDENGDFHFNGNFNNVDSLIEALDNLDSEYQSKAQNEKELLSEIFEEVFNHKEFTGRSGTFYGYEGLGSIYWHMVSKLALAVQECFYQALDSGASPDTLKRLKDHYYEIVEGIGVHKDPELYGAFPTDPYSHTPLTKGAQQPGMTGQVKEDILTRFGELGVRVSLNSIHFDASLLDKNELLQRDEEFQYIDLNSQQKSFSLEPNSLAFTYCQVPIVYQQSPYDNISVTYTDGSEEKIDGHVLGQNLSNKLFRRDGEVEKIVVSFQNLDTLP